MMPSPTEWFQTGPGLYQARLPGGMFQFWIDREDLPFTEICDVAVRNNARRRFLFVSRVLGRHWPVRPADLRGIATRLVEKVAARTGGEPTAFIGMAETATTLGQAVFREWRRAGREGVYIESTRRLTGGPLAFRFSESHSHATAHLIHQPGPDDDPNDWLSHARHVAIIDDEATTSKTAAGLASALRAWRPERPFLASLAVILRWNPESEAPVGLAGVDSIAEGSFQFDATERFPLAPATSHAVDSRVMVRRGARHGILDSESVPIHWNTAACPGERILVVGNGEHGFRPLVLAEALENHGAMAWVQATTRSPVLMGGAIGHVRQFSALSGEGHAEYLYNVPEDHPYDRVILCTEDMPPPQSHPIWRIPALEVCS
jgi:hypothetical protein